MIVTALLRRILLGASLMSLAACQALAYCPDPEIISVHCGKTPSSAFDANGTLWTAFVQGKHVYLTHSHDLGVTFGPTSKVNREPQDIYANGENRPKLAIGQNNILFISWTQKTKGRFNGDIRFSRSLDGGEHFDPVKIVNDDALPIGHRFDELIVSESGLVYLAWLDKRDREFAKSLGNSYQGISLYYTVSADQGKTFAPNRKVADHSCECCRLAMAPAGGDDIKVLWRHLFAKNTRDHAIITLSPDSTSRLARASIDDWQTDSCPHHGPAMESAGNNDYHLTWFSNGNLHKGIYYGRYDSDLEQTVDVQAVDTAPSASHPQVKQIAESTWLVWKRFEHNRTHLKMRHSIDAGKQWSDPVSISTTAGASDHPILIKRKDTLYVSWHTEKQGYQIIPVKTQ